jgi:endonuclease G
MILFVSILNALSIDDVINDSICDQIIKKRMIDICYDYNLKAPKAVTYKLYGEFVNENNIKKRPSFRVEREVAKEFRASTKDYIKSGYDRGHLACDAAFDWDESALQDTYMLSNITPQARRVNRYTWVKAERYARYIATVLGDVTVINIVEYPKDPKRIGKNKIAVPSGYYKILFNKNQNFQKCLYYKNDNDIVVKNDRLKDHEVECKNILVFKRSAKITCSSFKNRREAQKYFDLKKSGWSRLDRDGDGKACESLPY